MRRSRKAELSDPRTPADALQAARRRRSRCSPAGISPAASCAQSSKAQGFDAEAVEPRRRGAGRRAASSTTPATASTSSPIMPSRGQGPVRIAAELKALGPRRPRPSRTALDGRPGLARRAPGRSGSANSASKSPQSWAEKAQARPIFAVPGLFIGSYPRRSRPRLRSGRLRP